MRRVEVWPDQHPLQAYLDITPEDPRHPASPQWVGNVLIAYAGNPELTRQNLSEISLACAAGENILTAHSEIVAEEQDTQLHLGYIATRQPRSPLIPLEEVIFCAADELQRVPSFHTDKIRHVQAFTTSLQTLAIDRTVLSNQQLHDPLYRESEAADMLHEAIATFKPH
jgi:hypothetical protein